MRGNDRSPVTRGRSVAKYPLLHGPAQGGFANPQDAAPADGSRDDDERQRIGSVTVGGASQQLGAELRCPDAVALVEAIRKFQRAATDNYAATYEASALRGFAKETRVGYAAELGRLARMLQRKPGASARESLQDQLLQSVRESRSDPGRDACSLPCASWKSSARSVRSSSLWIGSSSRRSPGSMSRHTKPDRSSGRPCAVSGRYADSAPRQPIGSSRLWAPSASAWVCGQRRQSPPTLRTASSSGRAPKAVRGRAVKRRGPGASRGALSSRRCGPKNGYHPQRLAWFPTRATLHAHLRQLVARPGSGCALLCWHAWRRYGAAQLRCLGLPTPGLLQWGGWSTLQMLRVYAYPGLEWSFQRGGPLMSLGGVLDNVFSIIEYQHGHFLCQQPHFLIFT